MLSVLVFFFIALPAPAGAFSIMNGLSIIIALASLFAIGYAATSAWVLASAAATIFALLVNPYLAHFFGYGVGTTAILILCVVAGTGFAHITADRNEGYVRRQIVRSIAAVLGFFVSCASFLYWYGNPYDLKVPVVIAGTTALFVASYMLVSWAEGELGPQQAWDDGYTR